MGLVKLSFAGRLNGNVQNMIIAGSAICMSFNKSDTNETCMLVLAKWVAQCILVYMTMKCSFWGVSGIYQCK